MSSFILVDIDNQGYIKTENEYDYRNGYKTRVVHRESVNLDRQDGIKCYARLEMAKDDWRGPSSDQAVLALDDEGSGQNIYVAEEQSERLTGRLKIWSSCYGGWKVRKLNG